MGSVWNCFFKIKMSRRGHELWIFLVSANILSPEIISPANLMLDARYGSVLERVNVFI